MEGLRDAKRRFIGSLMALVLPRNLTSTQEAIWLDQQLFTGKPIYNTGQVLSIQALRFGEPLPALAITTPEEQLAAERRYSTSDAHEIDRVYWLEQFAQWPGPLLEIDRQNTERVKSGSHARVDFTLKRADFARLETAALKMGSSPFRMIVALSYVAFARLYDRYDLVLGLELANRSNARAKQTIGYFARPLPMLLTFARTMAIADTVRQIDEIRARKTRTGTFQSKRLQENLRLRGEVTMASST
jgi:hypothetical protein